MPVSIGAQTTGSAKSLTLPNRPKKSAMATIEDDDERLLAEIGYEQVRALLCYLLELSL